MKKTAVVVMLLIAVIFLAGCTTTGTAGQETARDTIRAHYEYHESWSPGPGCHGRISGYAYNAGNTTVDDVAVNFNLVNAATGTIRDSRSVFIGTMEAGQSSSFKMILDGECSQKYQVDGTIVK